MGNLQSIERGGALNKTEIDRLERRLRRLGRGRAEVARSDFAQIEGLLSNPFMGRIFQLYDTDNDGLLTLSDMKPMMELFTNLKDEESRCKFAFVVFDTNNDGIIDKTELFHVLQATNKRGMSDDQLRQIVHSIMAKWDPEGRGLEYSAFKEMLSGTMANLSL